jgi:hypothetical protein
MSRVAPEAEAHAPAAGRAGGPRGGGESYRHVADPNRPPRCGCGSGSGRGVAPTKGTGGGVFTKFTKRELSIALLVAVAGAAIVAGAALAARDSDRSTTAALVGAEARDIADRVRAC